MEKSNKRVEMISFIVLIILILGLGLTLYLRRNSITNVNKVLSNKFDEIKCIDDDCDYLTVYKKSKNIVYIYDSYGARISKYTKSNSNMLYSVTSSYILFKNVNKKGDIKEYFIAKSNGDKVYTTKNELNKLSDYLVAETDGDLYKVIDHKGKVLYSSVKKIKRYENISAIQILDDEYLIDEKGEKILSDYVIDKEVRNDKEETVYIILKDTSNAYYYFDVATGRIKGDGFSSYGEIGEDYSTVVYKKNNGQTVKYILKSNGEQVEDENDTQVELVKKIKENLNEKYSLYVQSVYSNSQTKVLVDNKENNSFGVFDLKEKKYKKVYDYTAANGSSILLNFDSYDGNKYFQVSCSEAFCGAPKVTVYDVTNGKVLYEYTHGENKIKYFTGLEGGYKLVKYTADSTEEYSDKYVLLNSKNEVLVSSTNMITVVDKKVIFGKKYDTETTLVYSTKLKKLLNNDETLADTLKVGSSTVYKYSDEEKTYLVSDSGKELFSIKNESSNLVFAKDVILNISSKKVDIIDAKNNSVGKYVFEKGENLLNENGQNITTYKNSIFVNSDNDNYGKIVDYSGNKIKKIKKTSIKNVVYSKKSNNVIIITGNGKKYGLYIAK